ncbi:hypothetical protein TRVL_10180 [Trypanosoma vivax]|nr:hypothetical protein TRVL_10180 [Trypanosoma vivax]
MAFHFSLALMWVILLNGAVLGDDSTSGGALVGADGKRNGLSRGGEAGCKSEGRARNGDKLVVLDSARTTPSETGRKSVSVMKRTSGQSSLRNRNEARNDHVGVGNELPDQPATSHKAQTGVDDKYGMKLPHARHPATSRHSEGGLTSKNPEKSAEVLDPKKEFENMVNGIIAEETETVGGDGSLRSTHEGYPYENEQYNNLGGGGVSGPEVPNGGYPSGRNASTSASVSSTGSSNSEDNNQFVEPSNSVTSIVAEGGQSSVKEDGDKEKPNNDKAPEDEGKEKKGNEEDGKEKGEKQPDNQKSDENSDGRETNNSSEDAENEKAPSSGNSAFLSGSYSSVLLVVVVCLCARAC